MSPVASGDGGDGGGFSFSVHHRQKENTKREKHAHTIFADSIYICVHIYTLPGSPRVVHSNGMSDTGATDQCRLIHIKEAGASTEG